MTKRLTASFATVLALGAANTLISAGPAHAASAVISCTGWTHATYTPGLGSTVRPTTTVVDGRLNMTGEHSPTGSCLALGSAAASGHRHVTALLGVSCTQFTVESGTETINWNDGRSTSFAFSADVLRLASNTVIAETGIVTSGEFTGEKVTETFTAPNTALADCTTDAGVTSLDFATVIAITP